MAKKKDFEIKTDNFYEQNILNATEEPAPAAAAQEKAADLLDKEKAARLIAQRKRNEAMMRLSELSDEIEALPAPEPVKTTKDGRKARKEYDATEAAIYMNSYDTKGRKGLKLPRASVSFTPQAWQYVKVMSQVRGQTESRFITEALLRDMERNLEVYKKALEFKNMKLDGSDMI